MFGQHFGLQNGRSLEQTMLLRVGCYGRAIIASVLYFIIFCQIYQLPVSFYLMSFLCPLVCYFYLCNSKHRSQECRVSSGILLHSEKGLNDYLNYYYLTTIPLKNSFIRNMMCIQKSPKNHPKTKTFQITVVELQAVCLKTMFFFPKCCIFVKIIHNASRQM